MNPICFYHRADFDGVCSAAIVKKFVHDCELFGIDYGDPFPWELVDVYRSGGLMKKRQVFMVDFSLKPGEMKRLADCSDLVWLDHHKSAIETCGELAIDGIRNPKFAGCELTWMWFAPEGPGSVPGLPQPAPFPEAVYLLGRYDVWDAKNPDWQRIEAFQFGMRAEAGAMSPIDPVWTSLLDPRPDENPDEVSLLDIEMRGRAILSYRDQEAKSLCADGATEHALWKVRGDPFQDPLRVLLPEPDRSAVWRLICLNSLQRGSWQFNSVWDPEKHDAMCVYGRLKNGKYRVSLYSTKEEVDCGAICKALGGGGHKGAAGFLCDKLPWES